MTRSLTLLCFSVTSLLLVDHGLALTVRIDPANGAPRIVVDGQPVRARMFFGLPGWTALPIGPEWKRQEFDFTATGGASNGTMHFRFGPTAGDVFLDEIQVTDLDSREDLIPRCDFERGEADFAKDWTYWPPVPANNVGHISVDSGSGHDGTAGLHVTLTDPPNGEWPDFHIYHQTTLNIIAGHRYHVSFWVRGTPARSLSVEFHRPGKPFVRVGGPPDPFISQIKLAADAGVNFVSFPIGLPWPKPGENPSWEAVDAACRNVLAGNPHALLIPRIPMNPPDWWKSAHPDEVMQWEDGRREMAVVASPIYRHDASERLSELVAHLEKIFGENVAGYHPEGQNTGEWFYQDTWKRPLNGYAPADTVGWRRWLRERYKTDDALRLAWNDDKAALDTAEVPSPEARRSNAGGIFHDAAREQRLVDWAEYQQQAMADCVCAFAHAARAASNGQKLVLFFYGYVFELAGVPNGPATTGHFMLRRILDSPDIDVVCAPISYFDRGLGGNAPAMSAAESVALAGKMWLNEDDTHTYLATGTPPGSRDHVTTLEDTNAELTRNVAQEAIRNFATWWMDLTATGWFNDPAMWHRMSELRAIDEPLLAHPEPFRPEVAAVVDERSMWRVAAGGSIATWPGVYEARRALGEMGAPYGQYLLDDVLAGRVNARLYVFLNAWSLSGPEREALKKATRGAVCIWCYAPGYFDSSKTSFGAMQALTGFKLQRAKPEFPMKAWAAPTDAGRKAGIHTAFGLDRSIEPLFAASDTTAEETLAVYPDGSSAVAIRNVDGETSIFVGIPSLTTELLRFAARQANVHLFVQTDCNLYADSHFLALHGSKDGAVEVDLGTPGDVLDLFTREKVGVGPKFSLPLRKGETRIFQKNEGSAPASKP